MGIFDHFATKRVRFVHFHQKKKTHLQHFGF